jgi:hypothetical protein
LLIVVLFGFLNIKSVLDITDLFFCMSTQVKADGFFFRMSTQVKAEVLKAVTVGNALSSSGTSQLGMFDIQATTKSKYYDHIVLLYLESRRCRYGSIIFACFYLYIL